MPVLYLVTHPEATHHVDRLVGGWFDSELTDRGIGQAGAVAERLAELVTSGSTLRLMSSDLRRTRRTAELIGERLAVQPEFDPRLREQSCGEAEGTPVGSHPSDGPGSEPRRDVATRVHAAVDDVLGEDADTVIVVGHGGSATFVVTRWIGMPLESVGHVRFSFTPGGITTLTLDERTGDRRVAVLNDTAHLGKTSDAHSSPAP